MNLEKSDSTLSNLDIKVIEMLADGISRNDIAISLGVSPNTIKTIQNKPQTQEILSKMITAKANAITSKGISKINEIIEAKLKKLEDDGKTLAEATTKDIVDLFKMIHDMGVNKEKIAKGEEQTPVSVTILNNILKDS